MQPRIELSKGKVLDRINSYNERPSVVQNVDPKIVITGNQATPSGSYNPYIREKNKLVFSGFGSRDSDGNSINGRIGLNENEKDLEYAQHAARGAALNFINNLATACEGDLDGVKSIDIRVDVNCNPEFKSLPQVADGASQLLAQVFGPYAGKPARATCGATSIPNDMSVEVTGEVYITKELAKKLDLSDARKLVSILIWASDQISMTYGDKLFELENNLRASNELHKTLMAQLQISANVIACHLKESNNQINLNTWNDFSKQFGIREKISSNQDLIDLIDSKAKNLNLDFNEAKLSKYSSLYGSAVQASKALNSAMAEMRNDQALTLKKI